MSGATSIAAALLAVSCLPSMSSPAPEAGHEPRAFTTSLSALTADLRDSLPDRIREARYQFVRRDVRQLPGSRETLAAPNPGHRFRIYINDEGVHVRPAGTSRATWTWDMRLTGFGRRGAMQSLPMVPPEPEKNRVVYRRGRLDEWYVNDRRGLEQGFTLSAPPAGAETGELIIELELSGSLSSVMNVPGRSILLASDDGETVLRYGGLAVFDVRGRPFPARLALSHPARGGGPTRLRILVDDDGAQYPLTVDPTVTRQVAKLFSEIADHDDNLGESMAIDGDTLVVGAPNDEPRGSAYVFERNQGGRTPGDRWPGSGRPTAPPTTSSALPSRSARTRSRSARGSITTR